MKRCKSHFHTINRLANYFLNFCNRATIFKAGIQSSLQCFLWFHLLLGISPLLGNSLSILLGILLLERCPTLWLKPGMFELVLTMGNAFCIVILIMMMKISGQFGSIICDSQRQPSISVTMGLTHVAKISGRLMSQSRAITYYFPTVNSLVNTYTMLKKEIDHLTDLTKSRRTISALGQIFVDAVANTRVFPLASFT